MRTLAFGAVVLAFFTTNVFVQRESNAIVRDSALIVDHSAPSIQRLTALRRAVIEAEAALLRQQDHPTDPAAASAVEQQLARVETSTRAYLGSPPLEREQATRLAVQETWARFDLTARRAVASSQLAAHQVIRDEVIQSRRGLLEQITRAIELHAELGQQTAARIAETRRRTNRLAIALNVVCALLTAVVAWVLHRQLSAQRALALEYTRTVEQRAEELEQFAGRVAHDIRNPLSAARLAVQLAMRSEPGPKLEDLHERVLRNLGRTEAITAGLLDFARSGAHPDPGARTEPREVISELVSALAPEAEAARIALQADPVPPVKVACSTGVYLSLVTNLVRNAMKYLGDAAERRVSLSVQVEGDRVRTSVTDTGPGIPAEKLPYLFDAYFRAGRTGTEGLGLGLATVKKLAEGHGGAVGVRSRVGEGTTVWFTLPNAGTAEVGER